jgi:hypothetical protein
MFVWSAVHQCSFASVVFIWYSDAYFRIALNWQESHFVPSGEHNAFYDRDMSNLKRPDSSLILLSFSGCIWVPFSNRSLFFCPLYFILFCVIAVNGYIKGFPLFCRYITIYLSLQLFCWVMTSVCPRFVLSAALQFLFNYRAIRTWHQWWTNSRTKLQQ